MPIADSPIPRRGPPNAGYPADAVALSPLASEFGHDSLNSPRLLSHDRIGRRESRLGLRNFFGRSSKAAREGKDLNQFGGANDSQASFSTFASHNGQPQHNNYTHTQPQTQSKSLGLRASMADLSHWPHGRSPAASSNLATSRSTQGLSTAYKSSRPPPLPSHAPYSGSLGRAAGKRMTPMPTLTDSQPELANWTMPPLFKAYPQAIRHATLPAASMSADAILRLNEKKNNASTDDINGGARDGEQEKSKVKKKQRNNTLGSNLNLAWTRKIFILVTSGVLLQYATEGQYDRLPEKVLHLGSSSAAFASDAIPGRHWVIQVSSCTDGDGPQAADSRSLFSRFRMSERRSASNLLLVFDGAGDMEEWIAILRREIEKQGGRRKMSETGTHKADDTVIRLREQISQRTLVVRDPARFSRSQAPSQHLEPEPQQRVSECSEATTDIDTPNNPSLDDVSTTNSVVSHDGRQLESLRDSSNSHRLSFPSSGQRTIITSAGSSPASSPVFDSFPSKPTELPPPVPPKHSSEARPRPNASVIANRRQSYQNAAAFLECEPRPHSRGAAMQRADGVISPLGQHPTPNFSIPYSSRRYSQTRMQPLEGDLSHQQAKEHGIVSRYSTRQPPTTMRVARPLSVVVDQPSTQENLPERPVTRHGESDLHSLAKTGGHQRQNSASSRIRKRGGFESVPARNSSLHTSPRRVSGMGALRKQNTSALGIRNYTTLDAQAADARTRGLALSTPPQSPLRSPLRSPPRSPPRSVRSPPRSPPPVSWVDDTNRRRSVGLYDNNRSRSVGPPRAKRASMQAVFPGSSRISCDSIPSLTEEKFIQQTAPPTASLSALPPVPTLASSPRLKTGFTARSLFNRKSMPHLMTKGPPPAPPPTCALPPIPQVKQAIRA